MNVLLTSAGRRAYMVNFFKQALKNSGTVHVANSDDKSVAMQYADKKLITPLIYDSNYIRFLLEYCKENSIDIVISLFDADLIVLSKHKKEFEAIGTKIIVSDPDVVKMCNDKWETYNFLTVNGFKTPKTFLKIEEVISSIREETLQYPIIVKPRFGCGSIAVSVAYDDEELRYLANRIPREIDRSYLKYESANVEDKVVYQEFIDGQEYGADIINDLNGNFHNVILKKKIAMRSGETDIAEIVEDSEIKNELTKLGNMTGHIANMDCDLIMFNGMPYILEMNVRFGGGYPFSHMAGCNLPEAILNWVSGKDVPLDMLSAKTHAIGYKEISVLSVGE